MFKKTAAAYGLAQEFLQRGDSRNARLAMDIGDRFEKAAGALGRGDRLHPAIVEGDLEATNKNLNLMGDYLKKVHSRVSKISPNVFSGMGTTGSRSKEALEHLQKLQGVLDSVRALTTTNKGRKSLESNMALEHLKDIINEDIKSGLLEGKDAEVMENYIMFLQPATGRDEDSNYLFKGEEI
jgi:hypothetical protein